MRRLWQNLKLHAKTAGGPGLAGPGGFYLNFVNPRVGSVDFAKKSDQQKYLNLPNNAAYQEVGFEYRDAFCSTYRITRYRRLRDIAHS